MNNPNNEVSGQRLETTTTPPDSRQRMCGTFLIRQTLSTMPQEERLYWVEKFGEVDELSQPVGGAGDGQTIYSAADRKGADKQIMRENFFTRGRTPKSRWFDGDSLIDRIAIWAVRALVIGLGLLIGMLFKQDPDADEYQDDPVEINCTRSGWGGDC